MLFNCNKISGSEYFFIQNSSLFKFQNLSSNSRNELKVCIANSCNLTTNRASEIHRSICGKKMRTECTWVKEVHVCSKFEQRIPFPLRISRTRICPYCDFRNSQSITSLITVRHIHVTISKYYTANGHTIPPPTNPRIRPCTLTNPYIYLRIKRRITNCFKYLSK